MPDKVTYRRVKESDVEEIVESHIVNNVVVERLTFKDANNNSVKDDSLIDFYKKQKKIALNGCGVIDPSNIDEVFSIEEKFS